MFTLAVYCAIMESKYGFINNTFNKGAFAAAAV